MAGSLVKQFAVALLTAAIVSGPVLAGAPSCCAARRAGILASCCCGRQDQPTQSSCCAKHAKSCCQKKLAAMAATKADALKTGALKTGAIKSSPSCCCKIRQPVPAIPAEENPPEIRSPSHALACGAIDLASLSPYQSTSLEVCCSADVSAGRRIQVLFCRWTV
jgi:hypothetical protein